MNLLDLCVCVKWMYKAVCSWKLTCTYLYLQFPFHSFFIFSHRRLHYEILQRRIYKHQYTNKALLAYSPCCSRKKRGKNQRKQKYIYTGVPFWVWYNLQLNNVCSVEKFLDHWLVVYVVFWIDHRYRLNHAAISFRKLKLRICKVCVLKLAVTL